MLRGGGSPRNGTAIIEQIKGQQYKSAMGFMVQIDENADASGNYTLLALSDAIQKEDNGTGPLFTFGLVPVGTFTAMDKKNRLPVSTSNTLECLYSIVLLFLFTLSPTLNSSTWSSLVIFIGLEDGRPLHSPRVVFVAKSVSVSGS